MTTGECPYCITPQPCVGEASCDGGDRTNDKSAFACAILLSACSCSLASHFRHLVASDVPVPAADRVENRLRRKENRGIAPGWTCSESPVSTSCKQPFMQPLPRRSAEHISGRAGTSALYKMQLNITPKSSSCRPHAMYAVSSVERSLVLKVCLRCSSRYVNRMDAKKKMEENDCRFSALLLFHASVFPLFFFSPLPLPLLVHVA